MTVSPHSLRALAEASFPLARDLAAGLLHRPVPGSGAAEEADALCREIAALMLEAVPALEAILDDMAAEENAEDAEELCDELAEPALDLVAMARRVWEARLPADLEELRPLLAALLEQPVVALVDVLLRLGHAVLDSWAVAEDPDQPEADLRLEPSNPALAAALRAWDREHPGRLCPELLHTL